MAPGSPLVQWGCLLSFLESTSLVVELRETLLVAESSDQGWNSPLLAFPSSSVAILPMRMSRRGGVTKMQQQQQPRPQSVPSLDRLCALQ